MPQPLKLDKYTVLLLCPLSVELKAASLMLDEIHSGAHDRSPGQTVIYVLGRIGYHNVAIAGYPKGEVGIGVSGSIAAEALRDFPKLEVGLLVGVAAGIPSSTSDIRFGDVAVATPTDDNSGIIGYDLVKVYDDKIELKQWQNSTHSLLRNIITHISLGLPGDDFTRHLSVVEKKREFQRPSPPPASEEWPADKPQRKDEDGPKVHYGTILSGNRVIKSKAIRDMLRDKHGGIAIEMEAAGMMTRLPVAVVRGICDFADASKNKAWQPYAALTAAAYAKEMLLKLGPLREANAPAPEAESVILPDIRERLSLALPEECRFVGREKELAQLNAWLNNNNESVARRSVVALWGLSGVGKSQLVSKYVEQHPKLDVFWITSNSIESFEKSILHFLKVSNGPSSMSAKNHEGYDDQRKQLIAAFFTELKNTSRPKWLLVLDSLSTAEQDQEYVRGHIKRLPVGSIIITTRSKELADAYSQRMEVRGLPDNDALELLRLEIPRGWGEEKDILELAKLLKGHPLALKLATSILSRYPQPVSDYVKRWKARELAYNNFLAHAPGIHAFEVSFEELENTDPLATKLLTLFSFLNHRDMWYALLEGTVYDSDYPEWIHQLADEDRFKECVRLLCDLSFIEAKPNSQKDWFYEIHPAIHDFSMWKAESKAKDYVPYAVSMVADKVPRSTDHDVLQVAQRLEPHIDQCMWHLKRNRGGPTVDFVEQQKFGDLYRLLGRYEEARWLYNTLMNHLRDGAESEINKEMMATIENNLGLIYHAQQQYDFALESFEESTNWMLRLEKNDEDALKSTLYNKGRSLVGLCDLEEGEKCLKLAAKHFSQALRHPKSSRRDEHLRFYFRILNDLGESYLQRGDLNAAEREFKEAFDGLQRYLHAMHPVIFTVRVNIGRVCIERSLFSSARKIFEYVIETYMMWWGRRHPDTMRAIDELAHSCMKHGKALCLMGDWGEQELKMAEDLWKEALQFYEETYGSASDVAKSTRGKLQDLQSLDSLLVDSYQMYYTN